MTTDTINTTDELFEAFDAYRDDQAHIGDLRQEAKLAGDWDRADGLLAYACMQRAQFFKWLDDNLSKWPIDVQAALYAIRRYHDRAAAART
jgi:hypothetical protein